MALPADEEVQGGIVINPASEWGKELRKWEQHLTHFVGRGQQPGNPYVFRPYPRMLYKAFLKHGKILCGDPSFNYFTEREILDADRFTQRCQITVQSEDEERVKKNDGWRESPQDAIDACEAREQAIGNASAEAHFAAQGMTATARREWHEAGAQTSEHVVDVKPVRKRGRPSKKLKAIAQTESED